MKIKIANIHGNTGSRAGVTLLELLVAVAITLIVGASIVGALYSGRSAYESGDAIIYKYETVRAAVDFISRDLASAYIYPAGGANFYWDPTFEYPVDSPLYDGTPFLQTGDEALEFTALISAEGEIHELRRIWYWRNDDDDELMRAEWKLRTNQPATVEVIAENITGLEFRFQSDEVEDNGITYPKTWYTSDFHDPVWDLEYPDDNTEQALHQRGRLPRAVWFELMVRDRAGNLEPEPFSSLVFIPMSGRVIIIP